MGVVYSMATNRQKMYITNSLVRKHLLDNKWECIYLFPHLRHLKDYHVADCGFDAIAWKYGIPWLIQIKTNMKLPKKELKR